MHTHARLPILANHVAIKHFTHKSTAHKLMKPGCGAGVVLATLRT